MISQLWYLMESLQCLRYEPNFHFFVLFYILDFSGGVVLAGVGGGRSGEREAVNQTLIYPAPGRTAGLKGHQSYIYSEILLI